MANDAVKFWTFVPQTMTIGRDKVTCTGWFMFACVESEILPGGEVSEPAMKTDLLTPPETPITLNIPLTHLSGAIDETTANDVVRALEKIFSTPFNNIPKVPQEPQVRTPPSKRKIK